MVFFSYLLWKWSYIFYLLKLYKFSLVYIKAMSNTGDCTWGWLGSTEQFGRDAEPNEFIVIPKSQIYHKKYACSTQAAHCAIYADNNEKVFGIYNSRATILVSYVKTKVKFCYS